MNCEFDSKRVLLQAILLGLLLVSPQASYSHAGHDDAFSHGPAPPAGSSDGTVMVAPEGQQALGLLTQPVKKVALSESIQVPGRVEAAEDMSFDINPLVSGVVQKVLVKATDRVSVGTPLAVIRSLEVANALSALLEQRSQLKAEIDMAVTEMKLAESTSRREEMLFKEGISPQKDFLAAKSAYDVAVVKVKSARERLALATEAGRSSTRIMGLSDDAFERVISTSQVTADVSLLSPVAGTVTYRDLTPGESIDTRKRVFTILDLSQVWVIVEVFQERSGKVVVGQEVVITTASDQQLSGTVSSIGSVVDSAKRTLPVRIVVNNKDEALKPGTFVTGEIAVAPQKPTLVVPVSALIEEAGRTLVFVKRGEQFAPVDVVTGARGSGIVAVSGKIAEGEQVVVSGARQLYAQTLLGKRANGHEHRDAGHEHGDAGHEHGDAGHEHGDSGHEHGDAGHKHGTDDEHEHQDLDHEHDARSSFQKILDWVKGQLWGIIAGISVTLLVVCFSILLKKYRR